MYAPATATVGESFLWYKATDRLQLGAALLWKQGAFRGLASYALNQETPSLPKLTVGFGLQGIGTGNPGYFAVADKTFSTREGAFSAYVGAGWRTNEDHMHPLGGIKFTPTQSPWTLGVQLDGHNVHPFVTRQVADLTLGLYLVNLKSPGFLIGFSR